MKKNNRRFRTPRNKTSRFALLCGRRRQAGFTLTELILACFLIVGASAAMYSSFMTAHRWLQPQNHAAYHLAKLRMEDLHEAVRQDWWSSANRPLTLGSFGDGTTTIDGTAYTRTYTVTDFTAFAGGRDFRKVVVDVTW